MAAPTRLRRTSHPPVRSLLAVGSLLPGLFLAGCASGLGRPVASVDAVRGEDGIERARIVAHSFYFEPNRVVVHAGRTVELTLHNASLLVPHNLTIADSALSVSRGVGRKRTHRIRFTAPAPGEYEFFCHVGHHAAKGMKGVLVVVP